MNNPRWKTPIPTVLAKLPKTEEIYTLWYIQIVKAMHNLGTRVHHLAFGVPKVAVHAIVRVPERRPRVLTAVSPSISSVARPEIQYSAATSAVRNPQVRPKNVQTANSKEQRPPRFELPPIVLSPTASLDPGAFDGLLHFALRHNE